MENKVLSLGAARQARLAANAATALALAAGEPADNTVLVLGGAGYIGSHACLALSRSGFRPVVFDDLSNGREEAVRWGPLEKGDIRDHGRLREVFDKHRPVGVIHFAGRIEVGESTEKPLDYYEVNVGGSINAIRAAQEAGVDAFVFSSTCATYGAPRSMPMDEKHPQEPLSPYGRTKLVVERMLAEAEAAGGPRHVCLRYFNAAGAAPEHGIGEAHDPETHAVPLILRSMAEGGPFGVFGNDYDTRDGTCVRDYVHVLDLADAHVAALRHLLSGGASDCFNLGTGEGTSVLELVSAIQAALGREVEARMLPRRPGDAAELVADASKAQRVLGWQPRRGIDDVIASAARWHRLID